MSDLVGFIRDLVWDEDACEWFNAAREPERALQYYKQRCESLSDTLAIMRCALEQILTPGLKLTVDTSNLVDGITSVNIWVDEAGDLDIEQTD